MRFIADFHIHSHYSLATSKQLTPEYLDLWGKIKGIKVIGTGDFTHPKWIAELEEKLETAEDGLYKIKDNFKYKGPLLPKNLEQAETRFILSAEISNIYIKNGKVRKVHNVLLAPDFEKVKKLQQKLIANKFNITSDGRPIIGLDSKLLLEMCLDISEEMVLIPAHIWTPWFSVLGDKSGFDNITACYEDLTKHIFALETGLSSDPAMNWMCSFLDNFTLISNSDAHSPEKLGRNANIFDTGLSYKEIINAMKHPELKTFAGTVDLFPQEGKYHFDGHRSCNVCWSPIDTLQNNGICPVCGKTVTIGVTNRIVQLSDRTDILERPNRLPFHSIIPLAEMLAEIMKTSPASSKVKTAYFNAISKLGTELDILFQIGICDIEKAGFAPLSIAIQRMRQGNVHITEGFDGEYGKIRVFNENEPIIPNNQDSLFQNKNELPIENTAKRRLLSFDLIAYKELARNKQSITNEKPPIQVKEVLNPEQIQAISHFENPAIILAGPGTGKTKVLTQRMVNLVKENTINPEEILAISFTNKAATEIKNRVNKAFSEIGITTWPNIHTFHSLGYRILKEFEEKNNNPITIQTISDKDKETILSQHLNVATSKTTKAIRLISKTKQQLLKADNIEDNEIQTIFKQYQNFLKTHNLCDLDDLIYKSYFLLKENIDAARYYNSKFRFIMIDEYQDINYSQYQLIQQICMNNPKANLFVIGDPNQAIYGFRGSDISFIRHFTSDYPDAKVYSLNTSYRCTNNILVASANVLLEGTSTVLNNENKGIKINIIKNQSDKSEAEFIARTIEEMIGGLRFFSMDSKISKGIKNADINSLSDFAVLCRTKAQMEPIAKAFNDHAIPFQMVGENRLFEQKPVSQIIDALKHLFQPDYGRFLSISNSELFPDKLISDLTEATPHEIIEKVADFVLNNEKTKYLKQLNSLIDYSKSFSDIQEMLIDIESGQEDVFFEKSKEQVQIMTMHASKGLEFTCVFIAGCEEGIIPFTLFDGEACNLAEESRLFYVAMTRAKKYLYLTHALSRNIYNKSMQMERSSFISMMQKELLDMSMPAKPKLKKESNQLDLFS